MKKTHKTKRKTRKKQINHSTTGSITAALLLVGGGIVIVQQYASSYSPMSMQRCFYPDATINGAPAGWTIWCESDYYNCHLGDPSGDDVPLEGLSLGAPSSCESGFGDSGGSGGGYDGGYDGGYTGGSYGGDGGYTGGGYGGSTGGSGNVNCYYDVTTKSGEQKTIFCASPNIDCRYDSPTGTPISNTELGSLTDNVSNNPYWCEDGGTTGGTSGGGTTGGTTGGGTTGGTSGGGTTGGGYGGSTGGSTTGCSLWQQSFYSDKVGKIVGYEECDNAAICTKKDMNGKIVATCNYHANEYIAMQNCTYPNAKKDGKSFTAFCEGDYYNCIDKDTGISVNNTGLMLDAPSTCESGWDGDTKSDDDQCDPGMPGYPDAYRRDSPKCINTGGSTGGTSGGTTGGSTQSTAPVLPKAKCQYHNTTYDVWFLPTEQKDATIKPKSFCEDLGLKIGDTLITGCWKGTEKVEFDDGVTEVQVKLLFDYENTLFFSTKNRWVTKSRVDKQDCTGNSMKPGEIITVGKERVVDNDTEDEVIVDPDEEEHESAGECEPGSEKVKNGQECYCRRDGMWRCLEKDDTDEVNTSDDETSDDETKSIIDELMEIKRALQEEMTALKDEIASVRSEFADIVTRIEDFTFGPNVAKKAKTFVENELSTLSREEAEVRLAQIEDEAGEELYDLKVIPFSDTLPNSWYTDFAGKAKDMRLVEGTGESSGRDLEPGRETNVAEAITLFARVHGIENTNIPISDVGTTMPDWALAAAGTLESRGIDLDRIFANKAPYDTVTRGEVARLIDETLSLPVTHTSAAESFSDISLASEDEQSAISAVSHTGIMTGYGDSDAFGVNDPLNRAALVKILVLISDKKEE